MFICTWGSWAYQKRLSKGNSNCAIGRFFQCLGIKEKRCRSAEGNLLFQYRIVKSRALLKRRIRYQQLIFENAVRVNNLGVYEAINIIGAQPIWRSPKNVRIKFDNERSSNWFRKSLPKATKWIWRNFAKKIKVQLVSLGIILARVDELWN